MAEMSASTGVRNTTAANPRWLPDAERVRNVLRSTTTAHRLHADEQRSLLELLDKYELNDKDEGCVIFSQPQQCHCHEVDVEEQRLALQRQKRKQEGMLTQLQTQQNALPSADQLADINARIASARKQVAELDGQIAAL